MLLMMLLTYYFRFWYISHP